MNTRADHGTACACTERAPRRRSRRRHAVAVRPSARPTLRGLRIGDIVARADRDDENRYVVTELRSPWIFTRRISGSGSPGIITFPSALMLRRVG